VWSKEECCTLDTRCSVNFDNTCSKAGDVVDVESSCSTEYDAATSKSKVVCREDDCCKNAMETKCQSEHAQDCSRCAKYTPCLVSIDPRCIHQEALDCLPCDEEHGLADCTPCAPGFDPNCIGLQMYEEGGCDEDHFMFQLPIRVTEECTVSPPFASDGPGTFDFKTGTQKSKCNADCSVCEVRARTNCWQASFCVFSCFVVIIAVIIIEY
jgi:hypothetical protein